MKKPVILVVDDSKPILSLLKVILGRKFDVYAANDGFGAMDWLMQGNKPDLIISDLQMPNIDGTELITYLSNSSYYEGVPVLILSGADNETIIENCKNMRIFDYIRKPFDPTDLLDKIDKALGPTEQYANGSILVQ